MKKPGRTAFAWLKRMFRGPARAVEGLESPSALAAKAFFRRPVAVAALAVLVGLFVFVFVGPALVSMDAGFTDPLQANLPPNYSFLQVPAALEESVGNISGFGAFTLGVSEDGRVFIWGNTKNPISGVDVGRIPQEVQGRTVSAAAGTDHAVAITADGSVVGWGSDQAGQFGTDSMPRQVDATQVRQLVCGYQCTALVMTDGTCYAWGNPNAQLSLEEMGEKFTQGVKKVAFSNYYGLILTQDGTVTGGRSLSFYKVRGVSSRDGTIANLATYLPDKKAVDIAATGGCYAIVLDDGSLVVFGAAEHGEKNVPAAPAGEKYVSVQAGTRHFVALTDKGSVVAWGHDDYGQASGVDGKTAHRVYTGAKQTYLVNDQAAMTGRSGFRGYLMGTDSLGRDIFTRILHGGRMTMTIGAVAVLVSTVIAVVVGCLSGYFGGWVDLLLMRLTEVFSAIPFLPFAMLLSFVIRTMPIGETARIFIIMVILGLLSWTGLATMIRAQVLAEREKEFVMAAKSMGVRELAIAFRHILPNVVSVILVNVTLSFASCLLTESSLSYLGFGVQQPQPTWGNMLTGANSSLVIQNYWWQWLFPAVFLGIATISINIIGDALRDALDPKASQER